MATIKVYTRGADGKLYKVLSGMVHRESGLNYVRTEHEAANGSWFYPQLGGEFHQVLCDENGEHESSNINEYRQKKGL